MTRKKTKQGRREAAVAQTNVQLRMSSCVGAERLLEEPCGGRIHILTVMMPPSGSLSRATHLLQHTTAYSCLRSTHQTLNTLFGFAYSERRKKGNKKQNQRVHFGFKYIIALIQRFNRTLTSITEV